ncbi:membrane protein, partial [Bifidobacterium biavatii DSM 23969]
MSYESLSTIVVLVIVIIIMVGWLPVRTAKGMRKVAEHREDKYSSSLHLVEMDDGTRFSDEHTPQAKGIIMADQTRNAKYTPEHVAHVRQLRRAAIRRRRIVVVSLLTIAIVVLAISFPLHFSPLFALIPAAALATVLALGVHASAQAREWERKVAAERRKQRKAAHDKAMRDARAVGRAAAAAQVGAGDARSDETVRSETRGDASGEPATDVMEQREIRRALREAQEEQARALAAREARRA